MPIAAKRPSTIRAILLIDLSRLIAEKFGPAFGQITIYMHDGDSALGVSQFLMKGVRFGRLTASNQNPREREIFSNIKNVSFINVEDVGGLIGHSYYRKHPGVLSDIIQLINSGGKPGTDSRPLEWIDSNFWSLDRSYSSSAKKSKK